MTENHLIKFPVWSAFEERDDLGTFGNDALLLFALQLKFDIEDISTVAATSLTEGADDKQAGSGQRLKHGPSEARIKTD